MSRRIDWNPNHKTPDDQENSFVDEYLTWSARKKWEYLMELAKQGLGKANIKGPRRIEWK